MIDGMMEKHKSEREECNDRLEKQIPLQPKHSSELLNMIQIEKGLLKLKEYGEAHKVQNRINKLTREEAGVWENERRKKRLNTTEDEMKKKRILNTEMLLQKFQNVKKELQNYQIQEINKFNMQRIN